jgi:hypothetical protein
MADEFSLRSAIAFTERMQRVQLPEIVRGTMAERVRAETGQVIFFFELLEHRHGRGFDARVVGEAIVAFADIDGPQLSGPVVQVAE